MPAIKKLINLLENLGLDVAVIFGQSNITYFTGIPRLSGNILIAYRDNYIELLTPVVEYFRVRDIRPSEVNVIPYSRYRLEFDGLLINDLLGYLKGRLSKASKVGMDLEYINFHAFQLIKSLNINVIDLSRYVLDMRAVKDDLEVELLSNALRISEEALSKAIGELNPKATELTFAGILEMYMRSLGAEDFAFETIVASGINSAYPHAVPTSKELNIGEPIVIDFGASYGGYSSDITRTLYIGNLPKEITRTIEAVNEALNEAEDVIAPYLRASEVDSVVRKVLSKYGLCKYFIHSTGHGVGIEVHEPPRIALGSDEVLKPGMIITIEPGVYIPNQYGVRIEDMILITNSGKRVLNKLGHLLT